MAYSDTRAKIASVEDAIKNVACNQIAALVIYNLPGRDCAAKASNGELPVGSLSTYKTQYIDRRFSTCCCVKPGADILSHRCHHQKVPQGCHLSHHRA